MLDLKRNRAEMQFEVSRVIAAHPEVDIKPGPIVLVEGMFFEGPPVVLVYDPRRSPLFPGDEGILLITPFDLRPYYDPGEEQWIPLIDRGTYQVMGDRVSALTLGSDGNAEKLPPTNEVDIEHNAVIDWGVKYRDYPLDQFIAEIVQAARERGWVVEGE
jgi:hypothetical protein